MSIITVVRNAADVIERTVRSVVGQSHPVHEYVVIDGASIDGTLARLEPFRDCISHLVSEPDQGISDAWNKGLALVTGEVIGLINAGDEYASDSCQLAASAIAAGADLVYGDTDLVDNQGRVLWHNRGRYGLWQHGGGIGFYHPTVFARRTLYERIGGFNTQLRYAMDTDWILRASQASASVRHVPVRVRMLDGGLSVRSRYLAYGEYLQTLNDLRLPRHIIPLSMLSTGLRGLARVVLRR